MQADLLTFGRGHNENPLFIPASIERKCQGRMAQTHEQLNPSEKLFDFVGRARKQRDTHGLASVTIKGLEGTPDAPHADLTPNLVPAWKVRQGLPL
jgi:hypothetical protein